METCQNCGKRITDIRELAEVQSLGLAMRGKCPDCGGWVWADQLWKKTEYIDKRRPRANRISQEILPESGHTIRPKARKNRLESVLESQLPRRLQKNAD